MVKYTKKQFSLVELLVVIAIIAILVSLLIPILSNARLSARTAVSVSNLNQIYKGAMIYASDNDKKLCKSHENQRSGGGEVDWPRMIYENMFGSYSDNRATAKEEMANDKTYNDMMFCPVLKSERTLTDHHVDGRSSYSMNNYFSRDRNNFRLTYVGSMGKTEPYIMPGTSSNNKNELQSDANLEGSRYNLSHGYPAYSYTNQKTFGLFIDGSIQFMSISQGGLIDDIMGDRRDFK